MRQPAGSAGRRPPVAVFASSSARDAFLRHVALWNLVHERTRIEADPLPDGLRVRLRGVPLATASLVDAFGGSVEDREARERTARRDRA